MVDVADEELASLLDKAVGVAQAEGTALGAGRRQPHVLGGDPGQPGRPGRHELLKRHVPVVGVQEAAQVANPGDGRVRGLRHAGGLV